MNRALALIAVAACGGEAAAPDAGLDAREVTFPTCEPSFEGMWLERVIELLPPEMGRDLDGDEIIDNHVGTQGDVLNPLLAQQVGAGTVIVLFALPGLSLTAPPEPLEIAAYWPQSRDSDDDPSNNQTDREFLVSLSIFDADCQPHSPMTVVQTGLTFHAESEGGGFEGQVGLFNLSRATFDGVIEDDGSLTTVVTGAYPGCAIDRAAASPGATTSALDLFVGVGLQPDIDMDGDGIEQMVADGGMVVRCIDGDGTVIDGSSCACDPAIVDGFSAAVRFEAVPAEIVGTYP